MIRSTLKLICQWTVSDLVQVLGSLGCVLHCQHTRSRDGDQPKAEDAHEVQKLHGVPEVRRNGHWSDPCAARRRKGPCSRGLGPRRCTIHPFQLTLAISQKYLLIKLLNVLDRKLKCSQPPHCKDRTYSLLGVGTLLLSSMTSAAPSSVSVACLTLPFLLLAP